MIGFSIGFGEKRDNRTFDCLKVQVLDFSYKFSFKNSKMLGKGIS